MSSSPPSLDRERQVNAPGAADLAPIPRWRIAVLQSIAVAHILAGAGELLKVEVNTLWKDYYTGGPLGSPGRVTVEVAGFLSSFSQVSPEKHELFWSKPQWLVFKGPLSTGNFLGLMMRVHLAAGLIHMSVGYGLWKRRQAARWLDVAMVGLAGSLAIAHGIALVQVGGNWMMFGIAALTLAIFVAVPILAFLTSPETGALFANRNPSAGSPRRRRHWWMSSLQCLWALWIYALAAALTGLFGLGPMVEFVWFAAEVTSGRP
jgi:hypothetical protein